MPPEVALIAVQPVQHLWKLEGDRLVEVQNAY